MHTGFRSSALILLAWSTLLAGAPTLAQDAAGLVDAVANGDAGLSFRYRYEFVDDQNFGKNANASTLRTRLNYETGAWQHWTGMLEFDHVMEVLVKDFNSGAGTSGADRNVYPVVADPDGPDLNQLYLQYAPNEAWRTRVGRQRINLGEQRFVGGVGWRQNEQTYDSLSVNYDAKQGVRVFYSYVVNVARIFGSSVPAGNHEQSTHLLNGQLDLAKNWKLTGYAYLIDNDDAPAFSTQTIGVRAEGSVALGEGQLKLFGDVATQSDYGNAPTPFDTGYYRLQAIWTGGPLSAGAGMESLGADNGQGFRTPLATLHKFNGWADLFLATPATGLEDVYLRAGYKLEAWNLQAIFHDFSAETGSESYGSELDLIGTRSFGSRYDLMLKFASFKADSADFRDVTKAWVMFTARF